MRIWTRRARGVRRSQARGPVTAHKTCLIAVALLLSGCATAERMLSETCTAELQAEPQPRMATLDVGESFQAAVRLSTCGGQRLLTDRLTWSSSDYRVLDVTPSTGLVRARQSGMAEVRGRGETYSIVVVIPVVVR